MTLKELAEVAGVSQSTIRRTAQELFPDNFKNGVKTIFNEPQSLQIMQDVTKRNMVAMQNEKVAMQNEKVDYEVIGKMIGMAVTAALAPVVQELKNIKQPLQIEQPKQDYYSLMGYCSMNKINITFSEAKKMGMDLRKLTLSESKEIRKVPDERWGYVNSYPLEVLEEYFSV